MQNDADNYKITGIYYVNTTVANIPETYGVLVVFNSGLYVMQMLLRPNKIYTRRFEGHVWEAWHYVDLT